MSGYGDTSGFYLLSGHKTAFKRLKAEIAKFQRTTFAESRSLHPTFLFFAVFNFLWA